MIELRTSYPVSRPSGAADGRGDLRRAPRGHSPPGILRALVLVFLWLTGVVAVDAQEITARSGKVAAAEVLAKEFDSPMVLELPLPRVLDLQRDQRRNFQPGLRDFVCDDAAIYSLALRRGKTTKEKKGKPARTELSFTGHLRVRESHDRLVTLTFTLLKGEDRVHTVTTGRFEAEEEKNTRFEKKISLPLTTLEDLYTGEPAPQVEVVVEVVDD